MSSIIPIRGNLLKERRGEITGAKKEKRRGKERKEKEKKRKEKKRKEKKRKRKRKEEKRREEKRREKPCPRIMIIKINQKTSFREDSK